MWNPPTKTDLSALPSLYATEEIHPKDKKILMHLFIGGCDWYIAEYNSKSQIFFGFAVLNGDLQMAEWGYFSLDELRAIDVHGVQVDRDLHWNPRPAGQVELIRCAQRWEPSDSVH